MAEWGKRGNYAGRPASSSRSSKKAKTTLAQRQAQHDPAHQPPTFSERENLSIDARFILTSFGACIHYNGLTSNVCRNGKNCKSAHWCSTELQGERTGFKLNGRVILTKAQADEYLEHKASEEKAEKDQKRKEVLQRNELKRTERENNQSTRANRSAYEPQLENGNTTLYHLMFTKYGPGEFGKFHPDKMHPSALIIKKEMKGYYWHRYDKASDEGSQSIIKQGAYNTCGAGPHPLYRRGQHEVICSRCLVQAYCCHDCLVEHSDEHVWSCKLHPAYVQEYDAEHAESKSQNQKLSKSLTAQVKKTEQVAKEAKDVQDAELIAKANKAK